MLKLVPRAGLSPVKQQEKMEIWSQAYLDEMAAPATTAWSTCLVVQSAWNQILEEVPDARRIIARIRSGSGQSLYCALGSPLLEQAAQVASPSNALFLPAWMLEHLGIDGTGDEVEVDWLSEEAFPEATRILLRPHDSVFYHADAKEELERGLTALGVISQGSVVHIPLDALGRFTVPFEVLLCEPANVVLAEGDEVVIEFEEALDSAAQVIERPAPVPVPAPVAPDTFETLLPSAAAPQGHRLGGSAAPRRTADGKPWNPWREVPASRTSA